MHESTRPHQNANIGTLLATPELFQLCGQIFEEKTRCAKITG